MRFALLAAWYITLLLVTLFLPVVGLRCRLRGACCTAISALMFLQFLMRAARHASGETGARRVLVALL